MLNDNTGLPEVESIKVDEPQTKQKTLTQEQVNSILKRERERSLLNEKELAERVAKLEKERENEKIANAVKEKALKEETLKVNATILQSSLDSKVNTQYIESLRTLVLNKIDLEKTTKDEIDKTIDDFVKTFPAGVSKGTINPTPISKPTTETQTPKTNGTEVKKETKSDNTKHTYMIPTPGRIPRKVKYTDTEFNALNKELQSVLVKVD